MCECAHYISMEEVQNILCQLPRMSDMQCSINTDEVQFLAP